jgi:hypothetical protein
MTKFEVFDASLIFYQMGKKKLSYHLMALSLFALFDDADFFFFLFCAIYF